MVYTKYFIRKGKKLGPYYYKTVKVNGKTKTVYLGKKIPASEKKTSSGTAYIKKLQNKIKAYRILERNLKKKINFCNLKYKLGIINKDKHKLLVDSYLKERTLDEWKAYYEKCRKILERKIKQYKTKGAPIKKTQPKKEEKRYAEHYFDTYKNPFIRIRDKGKRFQQSKYFPYALILLLLAALVVPFFFIGGSGWITGSAIIKTEMQADFDEGVYDRTFYNPDGYVQLAESLKSGSYTSKVFDAGSVVTWKSISWVSEEWENTKLDVFVRICNDKVCEGEDWIDIEDFSPQELSVADSQYFQYKFEFETVSEGYSVSSSNDIKLYDVTLDYKRIESEHEPEDFNLPEEVIEQAETKDQGYRIGIEPPPYGCVDGDSDGYNISESFFNPMWSRRKEITILNTGLTSLKKFPAYIHVSYDSDMQTDFDDLRFVNGSCGSTDNTILAYEIENYTESDAADVWVEIPELPVDSAKICMYYGNNGASFGENATGVWDSNYAMVQHLQETSEIHYDSTGNGNNGIYSGGIQDGDGKVDGADGFYGYNNYISIADSATLDMGDTFTASLWVQYTDGSAPDNYERILTKKGAWNSWNGWEISLENGYDSDLAIRGSSSAGSPPNGADNVVPSWAAGGWHHIVVVYDGTTATVYRDGVYRDDVTIASVVDNDLPLYIGRYGESVNHYWVGYLDESGAATLFFSRVKIEVMLFGIHQIFYKKRKKIRTLLL